MNEIVKDYEKKIVLTCTRGQWRVGKVEIVGDALPLTVIDVRRIRRIVALEQRVRIRDMNLARVIALHESAMKKEMVPDV